MKKSELFQSFCNLTVVLSLLTLPCCLDAQEVFPYIGHPVPGLITDVELASTSGWEGVVHTGGLTDGARGFIDRGYEWVSVPAQLIGADYIETAQGNAEVHPFALDVTVKKGTILHLIIPEHEHLLPFEWMTRSAFGADWIDTGASITTSWTSPAQVWSTATPLAAGTYTFRDLPLDPNTGSYLSFYGIAATAGAKRIRICHWQPGNNAWKPIRVGTASIAGHFRNHDDAFPGGTTAQSGTKLTQDCEIALPECGDCLVNNGTPGCENGSCTDILCSTDPFCCEVLWDNLCAEDAAEYCLDEVCVAPTGTICGFPKPLEEGICLCGFPELFCTPTIINCETSEDCSEVSCGGLPTCVKAGNDFPDECGPDNFEGCFYVVE